MPRLRCRGVLCVFPSAPSLTAEGGIAPMTRYLSIQLIRWKNMTALFYTLMGLLGGLGREEHAYGRTVPGRSPIVYATHDPWYSLL
jgi:hypothetical protein